MPTKDDRSVKIWEFWKGLTIKVLFVANENKFLLATVLLAFIPLFWFRPWDTLITNGDFWIPLNPLNTIRQLSSSWMENISGGQINNMPFHLIPWMGFWALFRFFSFSLSAIEKLWFMSVFLVGGLSMYFLTKEIFENKKGSWRNFLPAVLFLFNLYIMINGFVTTNLLAYVFMPLLLLIYMKGIKSRDSFKYAFFLSLTTVFMASAAGNPPIYSIPFLLLLFFSIYSLIFRRKNYFSWKFNFQFLVLYLLFNAWWIYPFVFGLLSQLATIKGITAAATVGATSKFIDLVRLLGSWAFFEGYMGVSYFPFAKSYLNPVLATLTFLIPLLCVFGFVFRAKRGKPLVAFFVALAVFGIVLSHGRADDFFGRLNILIYDLVPFFWIYREPFAKFTALTAFSYSVLLGSLFSFLENRVKSRVVLNLFGVIVTVLVLTVSWPLVTGDHYPGTRGVMGSSRVKIQPYWFDMSNWFKGKELDGRVLVLPENPNYLHSGIPYAWGYDSADITPAFLSVPWIERNNGFYPVPALSDSVSKLAYDRIHGYTVSPNNISGILGLLNVSRVLQRNDIDLRRINSQPERYSPQYVLQSLVAQKDLSLEKSFGLLDVYNLNKEQRLDKFYVPNEIECIEGNTLALNYALDFTKDGSAPAIFTKSPGSDPTMPNDLCHNNVIVPVPKAAGTSGSSGDAKYFYLPVSAYGTYGLYGEIVNAVSNRNAIPAFSIRKLQTGNDVAKSPVEAVSPSPGLSYLGSYSLDSGDYVLVVSTSGLPNLLGESLAEGLWKSSLSNKPTPLSSDIYAGKESLDLSPGQTDAFYNFPVEQMSVGDYELSFFNKVNAGAPPAVIIWENTCDIDRPIWVKSGSSGEDACSSIFLVQPSMSNSTDWTEYSVDYKLDSKAKRAGIVFAFLGTNGNIYNNSGETLINSVSLRPKLFRGYVLEKGNDRPVAKTPEIKTVQHLATKYVVAVNNATEPFYLVFSENYSQDWQARIVGSDSIDNSKHFLANGYANSWHLEKTGNYKVEISYKPEKWFKIFIVISVLSVVGSGLLVLYRSRRKMCGSFKRNI